MSRRAKSGILFGVFVVVALMAYLDKLNNKTIDFNITSDFDKIKKKAVAENKLIFFDAYTQWCGPCRKMEKTTFLHDTIIKFFGKHFISYKMNMDLSTTKAMAKRYDIHSYPTYIFMDGKGQEIAKVTGYLTAEELLAVSKKVLENGNDVHLANTPIVNLQILFDDYAKTMDKHVAYKKIKERMVDFIYKADTIGLTKIYDLAKKNDSSGRVGHKLKMDEAIVNQNWKNYRDLACCYFDLFQVDDPREYRKAGHIFSLHVSDEESLKEAIHWISKIPLEKRKTEDENLTGMLKRKIFSDSRWFPGPR